MSKILSYTTVLDILQVAIVVMIVGIGISSYTTYAWDNIFVPQHELVHKQQCEMLGGTITDSDTTHVTCSGLSDSENILFAQAESDGYHTWINMRNNIRLAGAIILSMWLMFTLYSIQQRDKTGV